MIIPVHRITFAKGCKSGGLCYNECDIGEFHIGFLQDNGVLRSRRGYFAQSRHRVVFLISGGEHLGRHVHRRAALHLRHPACAARLDALRHGIAGTDNPDAHDALLLAHRQEGPQAPRALGALGAGALHRDAGDGHDDDLCADGLGHHGGDTGLHGRLRLLPAAREAHGGTHCLGPSSDDRRALRRL